MKFIYLDRKYIVTCWAAIDFCSHRDPFIPAPWDESDKSGARHWEKSVLLEAVPVPVSSEILKHEKIGNVGIRFLAAFGDSAFSQINGIVLFHTNKLFYYKTKFEYTWKSSIWGLKS